jgi:hypothetical protein
MQLMGISKSALHSMKDQSASPHTVTDKSRSADKFTVNVRGLKSVCTQV